MGVIALISDIHGNAEAFSAVLEDMERRSVERIYCLGDVVGYGPDPELCIDWARERCAATLLGNHDQALHDGPSGFNPLAARAIQCVRSRMLRKDDSFAKNQDRLAWLQGLPLNRKERDILMVHGTPFSNFEYVTPETLQLEPKRVARLLDHIDWVCFYGHTHLPGVVTQDLRFVTADEALGVYFLERGKKHMVNVGSVGQPRDGNNQACYATYDGEVVQFRRVPYEIDKTMEKIRAIDCLDNYLATRLVLGR